MSEVREPLIVSEPLVEEDSEVREALIVTEPVTEGVPSERLALVLSEPLTEGVPFLRLAMMCAETLHPVEPEGHMQTQIFPPLIGLTFNVTKRPTFSTRIATHQSGNEVRNANMQYPVWQFELSYDYLPDRAAGTTDLKNLEGFFLKQLGNFRAWLFQDTDDYQVVAGEIATGDGAEVQFDLSRSMGGFLEPVGQVAWTDAVSFSAASINTTTNRITATGHGLSTGDGPYQLRTTGTMPTPITVDTNYWVIAVDANTLEIATSQANAMSGTEVDLTSQGTGTMTLYSPDVQVYVNGVLQTTGYIVKMPNILVFDLAPADGDEITATFDFYFVCRFMEDRLDFEKFMDRLWQLQKCNFQSIPQ